MSRKQYSDAEKLAYYKKKASAAKAGHGSKSPAYYKAKAKPYKKRRAPAKRQPPGAISAIGGALGGVAGEAFGGPAGMALGTLLGGKAGELIENITGFGDYRLHSNTIMKGGMSPPQVVNSMKRGGYIVRHREYICDVSPSVAFTMQTFALNPGLQSSFPWLSQMANSFEEYKWRGLLFEFKSMSSDAVFSASSSSALGTVVMATQYNSLAPPFSDKRTMENYEFANSSKPSVSFIHPVECEPGVTPITPQYIRGGNTFQGDQRLYDLGEFCLATVGFQSADTGVIGELWATYEIEFFKNKYNPVNLSDHFTLNGPLFGAPFGTGNYSSNITNGSNLGGTLTATTYSFPSNLSSGVFMFEYNMSGSTNAVLQLPTVTISSTLTNLLWFRGDTVSNGGAPQNGTTTNSFTMIFIYRVTGQNAWVQFSTGGTFPTSTPVGDLWVTQLSNTITG